jgi:hypothetical protein
LAYSTGGRGRKGRRSRGEVGLGLGDTGLGAGELAGVAVDEVVHRLLGAELGDGRASTPKASAVRKMTFLGCPPDGGDDRAVDEVDGVGDAGVLGVLGGVVVGDAGALVDGRVLEHGAEADGVPDLGLALLREFDALGVAAALEVEDAGGPPAVLVVADEGAVGIGGERGLARAGEAEEERDVGGVALGDVAGAVHGEDALLGHVEVHGVEDALLHLAGVLGAEDHDDLAGEALGDEDGALDAQLSLLGGAELVAPGVDEWSSRPSTSASGAAALEPWGMKSVRAKRLCQACSVTTRTPRRCLGSAPAKPSKT